MSGPWTIAFTDATKRLDIFLSEHAGLARTQAKKQVEQGRFTVNGKAVPAHYFLKEGDVVETSGAGTIKEKTRRGLPASVAADTAMREARALPTVFTLQIIKETPDWIVLYKPSGVLMHPDHETVSGTLIDAVIAHAPQTAKVGEDPARPGIVSRLDKDVSGLVVIAKTQAAFEHLKHQFAEHTVQKEYVALVHGEVPRDEGDLKFRIARSTSKARMAARPATGGNLSESQAAWTHYEVLRRFTGATLLRLNILSGRTHQIRAHVHAFGHPVIGDPLYKLKQTKRRMDDISRTMLQSVKLAFDDPASGERMTFEIPEDPEFARQINTLSRAKNF